MKRQFDENINTGDHFDNLYSGVRRAEMMPYVAMQVLVPAIVQRIHPLDNVLDVGCGWGQYYPYLSAGGCKVYGIDFAEKSIEQAKELWPLGDWTCTDFRETIICKTESFNYVTCFETLEHMERPDVLINEIYRVLMPGGVALLSVPYKNSIVTPEHLWEYDEDDWRRLVSKFEISAQFRYSVGAGDMWEHFLVIARKA